MIPFLIVYSVIMFLVAAIAIAICAVAVHNTKQQKQVEIRNDSSDQYNNAILGVYGNGHTAFLLLDDDGGMPVYVSPNISNFFVSSAEEISADIACAKKHLSRKGMRSFDRKYRAWDKNGLFTHEFSYGNDKYGEVRAFTADYDGKRYVAFTFSDITEYRKKTAEMQAELNVALEQAAAKSTFLSSMSHEIRTPMNGVMGMMALAKMHINDPEKASGYLDRAGDLSVFLLSMINDILDISKIESGKMQLFDTQLDVYAFAEKIRNMFNGTVTGKGISFVVETIDFTERYFLADELRLTQVVTNLVSNANKFTPAGGKITVTFKQLDHLGDKTQLMIRVRDTGKGIAPENIRKIMRPFEQEEASTAHHYGGTGLGLSICDNIVRMMGGNIIVDSELGKGTDFSVFLSLPAVDGAAAEQTAPVVDAEAVVEGEDFTFDGCRILLAEDNEINAEIAVEILESEGAIVTLARDGQEAVEIFTGSRENSFDLLLLDIQMPRLNGRDAAREIRRSGRNDAMSVPIIALSADAFVEDVKKSEEAGMDGHVSKPIDFEELRQRSGEIVAVKRKGKK